MKDVVLSENRKGRPVLLHCEEPTEVVDGLQAIIWHQIAKKAGGDYWASSTQKYQGSVIKVNSKAYLKTLQVSQHLHTTEDKIRHDYIEDEKARTSLTDKLDYEK